MKRLISMLVAGIVFLTAGLAAAETSQPLSKILTSFDFSVVGLRLNASPGYQAVPKGISSKAGGGRWCNCAFPGDLGDVREILRFT